MLAFVRKNGVSSAFRCLNDSPAFWPTIRLFCLILGQKTRVQPPPNPQFLLIFVKTRAKKWAQKHYLGDGLLVCRGGCLGGCGWSRDQAASWLKIATVHWSGPPPDHVLLGPFSLRNGPKNGFALRRLEAHCIAQINAMENCLWKRNAFSCLYSPLRQL